MKDTVKIYVARTPNTVVERIRAPFFYNIIAGSDYHEVPIPEDVITDNTGDNISCKNREYCELTVQYWAWKNELADYYGFCHYRRFFSFTGERYEVNKWGVLEYEKLCEEVYPELGMDETTVYERIKDYDILVADACPVNIPVNETVYEHYGNSRHLHVEDLDLMLEVINDKYPFLSLIAKKYINGDIFYPFNMFIMKRERFYEYAEMLFSILAEVKRRIDTSSYSREGLRTVGHLGERFLGIYYEYLKAQEKYNCGTLQVALFADAEEEPPIYIRQGDNTVPVVFAADEGFIPVLGTCIQSLTDSASDRNEYEIYVFHRGINNDRISAFVRHFEKTNVHISFINVTRYVFRYRLKAKEHITTATFYRCLIPELLGGYDKVLYLDCDIIINKDVAVLYETDLAGCLIGAVHDPDFAGQCNGMNPGTEQYCRDVLKIDPFSYFQAGVLLFNNREFNASSITAEEMFNMADTGIYRYSDQDILNVLCEGRVKYIDMSWNMLYDFDRYRWEYVIKYAPAWMLDEYERARQEAYIIHYAGWLKPWHDANVDFGTRFWECARKTPYYEQLLQELIRHTTAQHETYEKKYNEKLRYRVKHLYVRMFPEGSRRREWVRKHVVPHAKKSLTDYISIVVEE